MNVTDGKQMKADLSFSIPMKQSAKSYSVLLQMCFLYKKKKKKRGRLAPPGKS